MLSNRSKKWGHILFVSVKPRLLFPGVRPGASRQFVDGGPEWTGTNSKGIRVCLYIPGNATDQTRYGAKRDRGLSRLCYGLRRCIPGVAPVALRCVPISHGSASDIDGRAQVLAGVSTASHGSWTAKPRCFTVAYK